MQSPSWPRASCRDASLACVILAHTDPVHVRRLIDALEPFPVFLHCDLRTPEPTFTAMTERLPARVRVMPRMRTGWARWENVAAEIEGYRTALATTSASHIALLTGSDYPLASADEITDLLEQHRGRSFAIVDPLPHPEWGQRGGLSRLRYRHGVWRKHMLRVPLPRRLPRGIVLAGGSQLKVLARDHARAVVDCVDAHPELVRRWRRTWVADETFVPSILSTPAFVPGWRDEHVTATLWWIGWDGARRKSPPWLTERDAEQVLSRRTPRHQEALHCFARKFSTAQSGGLLDRIDASVRSAPARGRRDGDH